MTKLHSAFFFLLGVVCGFRGLLSLLWFGVQIFTTPCDKSANS